MSNYNRKHAFDRAVSLFMFETSFLFETSFEWIFFLGVVEWTFGGFVGLATWALLPLVPKSFALITNWLKSSNVIVIVYSFELLFTTLTSKVFKRDNVTSSLFWCSFDVGDFSKLVIGLCPLPNSFLACLIFSTNSATIAFEPLLHINVVGLKAMSPTFT